MTVDLGFLVDHHCHGLVTDDLDRPTFESMMSEADHRSPLGTTLFDSTLGLAIRRWCAPVLDLDLHAPAEAYLTRRRELGAAEVNHRLVTEAGIATFLVDTGLNADQLTTPEELAATCAGASHEIVRLEAVAAAVLADGTSPSGFAEEVEARLRARVDEGAVGAKSIAAYRVGLGLPGRRATHDELVTALSDIRPDAAGRFRIAQPVVNGWLAWTAIELGMPLQFHVGYGDNDVDLAECDPLRLTAFLRATQDRGVPVLLLHNYPFHRNAAFLAQVFDQVFMDVGLAVHNTGALSAAVVRESLELAPFGKMLFSSDAYGLAELYHLGALLFRRGVSGVLGALVDDGEMSSADAADVARLIGRENARRAYRLDGADVPG